MWGVNDTEAGCCLTVTSRAHDAHPLGVLCRDEHTQHSQANCYNGPVALTRFRYGAKERRCGWKAGDLRPAGP
jgi:hypothetical protein